MKNKKTWITIIVLVLLLGGCFGDRVISEIVFYYQCDKNSGLYVYEEVGLSDEYFTKESKSEKEFNYSYISNIFIKKNRFDLDYKYTRNKNHLVSIFGPVKLVESVVVRKLDNKVLGKNLTIVSGMGWVNKLFSFGYSGKGCVNERGVFKESYRGSMQINILSKIFLNDYFGEK
jgi:hypothetical protein